MKTSRRSPPYPTPSAPPASLGPRLNLFSLPASVRLVLDRLREGRIALGDLPRPLPSHAQVPRDLRDSQGVHGEDYGSEVAVAILPVMLSKHREERTRVLVAMSVALMILVGCSEQKECTAIGYPPTLSVDVAQILAQRDEPMRVTVCVGSRCRTATRRTGVRDGAVLLYRPRMDDEGPVEVGVVVETHPGVVIYQESVTTPLKRMQPNGPGCDPITYSVALKATDGGLVPQ